MYAIVKAGGHQEKVEVGDVILVNRLDAKKGDTVSPSLSMATRSPLPPPIWPRCPSRLRL